MRETKTRHCQPPRHRNRHPPRETLNHFYCIELSLLPAARTSKRRPLFHFRDSSPRLSQPPTTTEAQIIRARKHSHPFGCPNGISSLIRKFTSARSPRRDDPLSPRLQHSSCPAENTFLFQISDLSGEQNELLRTKNARFSKVLAALSRLFAGFMVLGVLSFTFGFSRCCISC